MLDEQAVPRANASKVDPRFPSRQLLGGMAMVTLKINGKRDMGGEGPEQVAISIVAEMLAVRADRESLRLRMERGSIHEQR